MRQAGDIKWCDIEGLPCTLARQQDLKSVQNTKNGIQKTSASDVVFRYPDYFVAGELHTHLESWNFVFFLYTQSKNLQFNKTYLHQRYHWELDRHGYPK